MLGRDVGAQGEEFEGVRVGTQASAAGPVLEAGRDQVDADEHDGRARHDGREDAQDELGRHERDEDLEQGADGGGAKDGAVGVGTRQRRAIGGGRAEAVGIHLRKGPRRYRDDGEGDPHDGDEARADVIWCPADVEPRDLDGRQKARDNQRGRHEILRHLRVEVDAASAGHDDGRGDDAGQHGERMLEAQDQGQHHRHPLVQAKEGRRPVGLPHEGEVGAEEEGIVVVADEAVLGEKGPFHAAELVGHGPLRRPLRDNLGRDLVFVHGGARGGPETGPDSGGVGGSADPKCARRVPLLGPVSQRSTDDGNRWSGGLRTARPTPAPEADETSKFKCEFCSHRASRLIAIGSTAVVQRQVGVEPAGAPGSEAVRMHRSFLPLLLVD